MTREEIIRNLKYTMEKHKNDTVSTFDTNISVMCKDILDYLEQEPKMEWIPVSERLPDNNVRVLCSAISTSISGGYTRFVGCCDNGDWFVQTDAETVSFPRQYKVTAWMPLPEPYKADMRGET